MATFHYLEVIEVRGCKVAGTNLHNQFIIDLSSVHVVRGGQDGELGAAVNADAFAEGHQAAQHVAQLPLMEHVVVKHTGGARVGQDVLQYSKKKPEILRFMFIFASVIG